MISIIALITSICVLIYLVINLIVLLTYKRDFKKFIDENSD
jgi:hypothetical protein